MRAARPPSTAHAAGRLRSPCVPRAAAQAPQASASKPWSWLGHVAAVLAAATLITTLFGYGVLMGLAQPLGLDHNLFINAPLDPILAAWAGVLGLFKYVMTAESVAGIYSIVPWRMVFAFAFLCVLAVTIHILTRRIDPNRTERTRARLRALRRSDATKLIVGLLGPGLLVAISPLLIWLALSLTFLAVAIVPSIGDSGARAYAERFILPVTQCFDPTQPADAEANATALPCVTLQPADKAGAEPKTGVIVVATSAYALLYHPGTRLAERVPVQNVTVQTQRPVGPAK